MHLTLGQQLILCTQLWLKRGIDTLAKRVIYSKMYPNFDVEYIYGFVWSGGLQTNSMTSQRYRAAHKMADMRYYGNVMTTTRWRLNVTMETLWQQQDGGYALL